jgi:hypothetical protein
MAGAKSHKKLVVWPSPRASAVTCPPISSDLRYANGEVKEILDALQDGIDRRYFTEPRTL